MAVSMINLAPAFSLKNAREAGLRKDQVYALLDQGEIERVGRGLHVRPDVIEPALLSLAAATTTRAYATLCLTSALVHHDLSDAIAFDLGIALPRRTRHLDGLANASYSAERTIVDCASASCIRRAVTLPTRRSVVGLGGTATLRRLC
jgi:predicted transcriptional regulator of viral defense system